MFFDDHKKAIATMMAKRKPEGGAVVVEGPVKAEIVKDKEGDLDGRHAAAQDAMAAFHEKSPMKLMDALSNFIDIHNSKAKSESASGDDV